MKRSALAAGLSGMAPPTKWPKVQGGFRPRAERLHLRSKVKDCETERRFVTMSRRTTLSVTLTSIALGACSGQVGSEYQGEPLLSIRGSVILDEENAARDLVPAIAFDTVRRNENGSWSSTGLTLVDVAVSGDFPARFRLDLFEPPPANAQAFSGEDPGLTLASGYITALPPDHPDQVLRVDETFDGFCPIGGESCIAVESTCDLEETPCTTTERWCLGALSGDCYERISTCTDHGFGAPRDISEFTECELSEEQGDPTLVDLEGVSHFSDWFCLTSLCSLSESFCDLATSECYVRQSSCVHPRSPPLTLDREDLTNCTVTEESGDPALAQQAELPGISRNVRLVYVSKATPELDALWGTAIEPGYVLFRFEGYDESLEAIECTNSARDRALAEYNASHGTTYDFDDGLPSVQVGAEIDAIEATLLAECPEQPLLKPVVIDDSAVEPITIRIGSGVVEDVLPDFF